MCGIQREDTIASQKCNIAQTSKIIGASAYCAVANDKGV